VDGCTDVNEPVAATVTRWRGRDTVARPGHGGCQSRVILQNRRPRRRSRAALVLVADRPGARAVRQRHTRSDLGTPAVATGQRPGGLSSSGSRCGDPQAQGPAARRPPPAAGPDVRVRTSGSGRARHPGRVSPLASSPRSSGLRRRTNQPGRRPGRSWPGPATESARGLRDRIHATTRCRWQPGAPRRSGSLLR